MSYGNPDVSACIEHLTKALGYRPQGSAAGNRKFCWLLLTRMKEIYPDRPAAESVKLLIDYGKRTFLGPMICDFQYLYYKHGMVIETIKRDLAKTPPKPTEEIRKYD